MDITDDDQYGVGLVEQLRAQVASLEAELAEAKAMLSDNPDHSDLDAAAFEVNRLKAEVRKQERARSLIEEANAEMAAALEWYADERHYEAEHIPECEDAAPDGPCIGAACTPICDAEVEGGKRARAALSDAGTKPCEKCRGTGARHVAGEPTQELCGECSGEGVISDAGEGWLPPEMREQARWALAIALRPRCNNRKCSFCEYLHDGYWATGEGAQPTREQLDWARAALDALEAK